ncbi:MAG: thiamine phosphate synthase [Clostridia bacterium]|nr:thiamine phosphate synthase [Clostridia bacterium]
MLKDDLKLYLVTDRSWLGKNSLAEQVEAAIMGGVTMVQLREKELSTAEFIKLGQEIKHVCTKHKIPFIINDDLEVALALDADGIHIGQSDMAAETVRKAIGANKILGVSAVTLAQAIEAQKAGADYLGVGAVFPTGSKADADYVSYEELKKICSEVSLPCVAIGGINKQNLHKLSGSGICGIAVISAILAAKDIKKASLELAQKLEGII